MLTYTVEVNGQQIDAEFPQAYDYIRLQAAFAKNRQICKPNYAIVNAFNILTSTKVCDYNLAT
jgi:hypothetical protein